MKYNYTTEQVKAMHRHCESCPYGQPRDLGNGYAMPYCGRFLTDSIVFLVERCRELDPLFQEIPLK